jgi:hypothetical protein
MKFVVALPWLSFFILGHQLSDAFFVITKFLAFEQRINPGFVGLTQPLIHGVQHLVGGSDLFDAFKPTIANIKQIDPHSRVTPKDRRLLGGERPAGIVKTIAVQ